jgi:tyrosyl-DNA phosphodiesterase 2
MEPEENACPTLTLAPHRFDGGEGVWRREPLRQALLPRRLTLVTYNLWFGDFRWRDRLRAVLDIVRACRPDLVALQEATPRHLGPILEEDWVRREFRVSDTDGSSVEPHGVLTLSRLPLAGLKLCELPSQKDRKLLIAELGSGRRSLVVGNVHLESSAAGTSLRLAQLDRFLPSLRGVCHAVLMGDFNFDPAQEAEQSRVAPHYLDLWPALRGDEAGYTGDTEINRMRLLHKGRQQRVRFDRVLLRSPRPGWEPRAIRLLGTRPIGPDAPDVFPSDHFGLAAELVWREGGDTGAGV